MRQIGREGLLKGEAVGGEARAAAPFRLLLAADGREFIETADIVLDCAGTYGNPCNLGAAAPPAPLLSLVASGRDNVFYSTTRFSGVAAGTAERGIAASNVTSRPACVVANANK